MPAEIRGKQPNKNCEERYQRIIFVVKVCEFGSLVHNLLLLKVSYILKDQRRAQFWAWEHQMHFSERRGH